MKDIDSQLIFEAYSKFKNSETHSVTVHFNDAEDAETFEEFMRDVAHLCNMGCSRRLGVVDGDTDEQKIHWDFDGDGHTRIEMD